MILTQDQLTLENSLRRILPAGVVSCWFPDGYDRAKDIIGGNHGDVIGAHPNVSILPNLSDPSVGWVFDEAGDDYVEIPHSEDLSPTDKISIIAWIKPLASLAQYAVVIVKPILGWIGGYGLTRASSEDNLMFWLNQHENKVRAPFSYDEWQYIVATYDGVAMKIFKNKLLVDEKAYSLPIDQGTQVMRIGRPDGYVYPFKGAIVLPSVANKDLSQAQINNFGNDTKSLFSPRGF